MLGGFVLVSDESSVDPQSGGSLEMVDLFGVLYHSFFFFFSFSDVRFTLSFEREGARELKIFDAVCEIGVGQVTEILVSISTNGLK